MSKATPKQGSHKTCPRCKKDVAGDLRGWFTPEACRAANGPKHLICRACTTDIALTAATICRENRSEPFLKCGFENCKHVWRYDDWMTSPAKGTAGELVQQFYVDLALAGMKDVRHCPACKKAGWIGVGDCPNTICGNSKCNFVFCSRCLSKAHKGICGSPQDEPDMVISSEKFFNLDAVLGTRGILRTLYNKPLSHDRKNVLSTDDAVVFTLKEVLRQEERVALLEAVQAEGFDSLEKVYPADYRSNDRLLGRSKVLASALFDRILPGLRASDLRHTPMGPSGEGLWLPCGLNEVFKFARYKTGCFFKPHRDGLWAPSIDLMSVFSVVIYLNSAQASYYEPAATCFRGGETRFFPYGGNSDTPVSVTPTAGSAAVFTQSLVHDGAALTSGTKYILRTEIMYRRVKSVLDRSPALLEACDDLRRIGELYKRSTQGMEAGKADQFLRDYLEAIELQAKPRPKSQRLPIPDDVLVSVLSLVSDHDIAQFARVNRSFYRLSRDNGLWRTRLRNMYPDVAPLGPQDLSVDWHLRYRNEILQRVGPRPPQSLVVGIDLGSGLIKVMRRGEPEVRPSFYTMRVEEYMSHGSRCKMDVVAPVTMKEAMMWTPADVQRHGALRAITDDHEITQKGVEVIYAVLAQQSASARFGSSWFPIAVVPDDWDEKHLTTHLRLSSFLPRPLRFVCVSEAVAKRFNVRSAVVLMLGHSHSHISVVENTRVTRIQYIENFSYSKCKRIAKSVHQVLLGSSPPPPPAALAEAQAAASAVLAAGQSGVNARMATVVTDLMKKVNEMNPYIQENARNLVGHRVLVTGGQVNTMAEWIAQFKSALAKRSLLWKVSIAQAHLDAVVGTASLSYFEEPVFRFGLSQPARRVPPLV